MTRYREAIAALSDRLGSDEWFLGSACALPSALFKCFTINTGFFYSNPTPLDALAFAYLHCILHSTNSIRIEVTKRVNLVAWEWRLRAIVRAAFMH